jgi:hypothetical protein
MLILSYIYNIPSPSSQRVVRAIFGNWQLSGISTFETGTPLNITLSGDNAGIGDAPYRPDLIGNPAIGGGSQLEWFNPAAFAQPVLGLSEMPAGTLSVAPASIIPMPRCFARFPAY